MPPRSPKKKPSRPSRRRYEVENPVVSVRVPRELYDALMKVKKAQGISMANVLQIGLGKAKPDIGKAWWKGADEGYETGYGVAKGEFEVNYWCSRCRRSHLSIRSKEEMEAAANLMFKAGWHDPNCRIR